MFGVEFDVPILASDELCAGKLVAALDRQHPRDLFDVWRLYESGAITNGMVECFVIYLAGHNRPPHEELFGNDKDIAGEYELAFVGMTLRLLLPGDAAGGPHPVRHEHCHGG